jgi:hypothetical protein
MARRRKPSDELDPEGEFFKDEVDVFSTDRERVALGRGGGSENDSDSDASYDQPVMALSHADGGDDDSEDAEDNDAEERGAWGSQRAQYYGGGQHDVDEDDVDPDDLAGTMLEEQEAKRLQRERLAAIGDDYDGGLFDEDEDESSSSGEDGADILGHRARSAREEKAAAKKKAKKKAKRTKASGNVMVLASRSLAERRRGMTAEEKLERMASESPELLALIEELRIRSRELAAMPQKIDALRNLIDHSSWATACQRGLGFLRLKQRVLSSYCMNIVAFLHMHAALAAESDATTKSDAASAVFVNAKAASAAQRAEADASALFGSVGLFDDDAAAAAGEGGGATSAIGIGERRVALRRHGSLAAIEEHIAIIKTMMPLEKKLKREMRAWQGATGASLLGDESSSGEEESASSGEDDSESSSEDEESGSAVDDSASDAEAETREAAAMRRMVATRRAEEAAFMGGGFDEDEEAAAAATRAGRASIAGRLRGLSKLGRSGGGAAKEEIDEGGGGSDDEGRARQRRKLSRYGAAIDPSVLNMVNSLEQKAQLARTRNGIGAGGGDDDVIDEQEKIKRREALLAREAARNGYVDGALDGGERMEGYADEGYSAEYLGLKPKGDGRRAATEEEGADDAAEAEARIGGEGEFEYDNGSGDEGLGAGPNDVDDADLDA